MTEKLGESIEDYLEAMLMLKNEMGIIRSCDVADKIGVSKPSVTHATKKLRDSGHITMKITGEIELTESGMKIAENMLDRHESLTKVLMKLGVSEEQARIDACKIEHDLSEESYNALLRYAKLK